MIQNVTVKCTAAAFSKNVDMEDSFANSRLPCLSFSHVCQQFLLRIQSLKIDSVEAIQIVEPLEANF